MNIKYEIKTLEDWRKYFPPVGGDNQWKDGFSAKELAKIVLGKYKDIDFEKSLKTVFEKQFEEQFSLIPEEIYPERLSLFDGDWHGPRHHDLACICKLGNKKIALCFEAKVFEKLDVQLQAYAKESKGKKTRLEKLCKNFFTSSYNEKKYGHIYYQILSSIAGTIAFAQEKEIDDAYFILYQIIPEKQNGKPIDKKTLEQVDIHKKALNDFILCMKQSQRIEKSGEYACLDKLKIERKNDKGEQMQAKISIVYIEQTVSGDELD